MKRSSRFASLLAPAALALALAAGPAAAAVTFETGDDFYLSGKFDLNYADAGFAGVEPAVYVGGNEEFGPSFLDTLFLPLDDIETTGLIFDYTASGAGSAQFLATYRISNTTGQAWRNLRFFADVFADPGEDTLHDASAVFGAKAPGDPDHFGIDDVETGDLFTTDIQGDSQLDNTDQCGAGTCKAEVALQWDLDTLPDGQSWVIQVLFADDGTRISERYLSVRLTDAGGVVLDPAQVLTVSGKASLTPVPLPAAGWLLGAGLLVLLRRKEER